MFLKKIDPALQESLETEGYEKAFPFQKRCIGRIKSGGDLIAFGLPGTGKTSAYIISLIQSLKRAVDDVPRAMVVCKDKEAVLACQELAQKLGSHTDLRFHVGFEGANLQDQKDTIYFGTDVVIGTPRRIGELMSIEGINFASIHTLVIDDDNAIMKSTPLSQIHRITESLPNAQKIVFSEAATIHIERYSQKSMKGPMIIDAKDFES